ncbi:MAG: TIGR03663 family protein [Planctomycetota bacterium]|jgi:uncharacterized protein (TIGR03663 family)|nr:TIGR03663 family protein [Planctomycetota bacterium]
MKRERVCQALIILAAIFGLSLRLPRLELRPLHTDEAVQAVKTGELLNSGKYVYNPHEFHGPTLQYISLPVVWLFGGDYLHATERAYRLIPVFFGTALILLSLGFGRLIGWRAAAVAAALTAVSPAMTYYSRYYIHEMLLVAFSACAYLAWKSYGESRSIKSALSAGVFTGLMFCTKETWIVAVGCGLAAAAVNQAFAGKISAARILEGAKSKPFLVAVLSGSLLSAILFTGFFTNGRGILDAFLTYGRYLSRAASGEGHQHSFLFFLKPLIYFKNSPGPYWTEALILVFAVIGGVTVVRCRLPCGIQQTSARFIFVYTLTMLLIYSAIPYKTPWCMLGFLHGMILLAGIGFECVYSWPGKEDSAEEEKKRWAMPNAGQCVILLTLLVGLVHLWQQSQRANFRFYADRRNPYVYAHSGTHTQKLRDRMVQLAEVHEEGKSMRIHFFMPGSDFWPMPWYLRAFDKVGYWTELIDAPDAPVIIADPLFQEEIEERLKAEYQTEYFGLRPGVNLLVYIEKRLWKKVFPD